MTESIYFNTGFVYRFGRTGIVSFGGEESALFEFDTVQWKKHDIPIVIQELEKMKLEQNLPNVEFSTYDKNKSGTAKMLTELVARGGVPNDYLLGCVIYHQLLYKVPLQADFLTGYRNDGYTSDCCDSSDSCNSPFSYSDEESE
jgi:hypothetical protein